MIYIQHRVNRIEQLRDLATGLGAEIDLHSDVNSPGAIYLQHDLWDKGDDFETYLDVWAEKVRGPLILNTKEDALEDTAIKSLARRGIEDYLFLDTTPPTMKKWADQRLGAHLAIRLSSMEPLSGLKPWLMREASKRPAYVWVDCYDQIPLDTSELQPLTKHFRPILVSPDLQGDLELKTMKRFFALADLCQFICTKQPQKWEQALLSRS